MSLLDDARRGLLATPKSLPPIWFYDEGGSKLFERITLLPEYYPTETERAILRSRVGDILDLLRQPTRVAELGAGSASKTRVLLAALLDRQERVRFSPIDVSGEALRLARENLAAMPLVEVEGIVARNRAGVRMLDWTAEEPWLLLFLGGSIGNLEPDFAVEWLAEVTVPMRAGDVLLLGVDRDKDPRVLEPAYDDAQGVTAEFNLNLIDRLNRELGAAFRRDDFEHVAFYNGREHRIEMHLRSLRDHVVHVPGVGDIPFRAGETIHTENSYKYTEKMLRRLVDGAGLSEVARFEDARGWFTLLALERRA